MTTRYEMTLNHHELQLPIVANAARTVTYIAPRKERIKISKAVAPVAPTSALGTYLLTVTKNAATNVLAAANLDLETLVAVTPLALGLSAVAGVLDLEAGDVVRFTGTSDNADLVVTGHHIGILLTTEYR